MAPGILSSQEVGFELLSSVQCIYFAFRVAAYTYVGNRLGRLASCSREHVPEPSNLPESVLYTGRYLVAGSHTNVGRHLYSQQIRAPALGTINIITCQTKRLNSMGAK